MQKINQHIEIVSSSTSAFSSMSAKSRDAARDALAKHYETVGITFVNDVADLKDLVAKKPDLVFLGRNAVPLNPKSGINDPDKVWISQYLDAHAIAYTGSNREAHELGSNKHLAKQRVLDAGLKTSQYGVIKYDQPQAIQDINLAFPLFVKPTNKGGGIGIDSASLVANASELASKVRSITGIRSDSLIEEYLPGREFSVAILKNEYTQALSAMPIELVTLPDARGARILGQKVKASNTSRILEVTDKRLRSAVCTLAIDAFEALGARDYGRVDIRLDASGTPHFLEVNLLPSLISGYGSFPIACQLNMQLGYEAMLLSIVRLALSRSASAPQEDSSDEKLFTYSSVLQYS